MSSGSGSFSTLQERKKKGGRGRGGMVWCAHTEEEKKRMEGEMDWKLERAKE